LGLPQCFLITAGDMQILSMILDAANRYEERPSDEDMQGLVAAYDIQPIFSY
jgi:hypothetical protein